MLPRPIIACLALVVLLAGCSSPPTKGDPASEADFDDFDAEATATTGIIRGVVLDPAIRPVAGAQVTLQSTDMAMATGDDGLFLFSDLAPGTYFLQISKIGFNPTQSAAEVVAGVDDPPIVKVLLQPNPGLTPSVDAFDHRAFITCGAAVVATSVGCNTYPALGAAIGDNVYFQVDFTVLPSWSQGELIWKQTQPAGGQMIWEIVPRGSNTHFGYRETAGSPALAYLDDKLLEDEADTIMEDGITYRIFGGPHPLCTGVFFGCGLTLNQEMHIYVHNFYNFLPDPEWRFSENGPPALPS